MRPAELKEAILEVLRSEAGRDAIRDGTIAGWHFVRQDTRGMMDAISTLQSADFVLKNIPLSLGKPHYDLRRDAVLKAPDGGLFMEFGVWRADWINRFAAMRNVQFYGFDSFEGLPEAWSTMAQASFSREGVLPSVAKNVELVKGWFIDTLPRFLAEHPQNISFMHIDCDLYSSTMDVLNSTRDRLQIGTQIVMDDFMLMPGWQNEEHRAFFDFVKREHIHYEYTGYSNEYPGCSASVVLVKV
jgi:hypothetical protein